MHAVLVSLLESDSELYNGGIVDVSYKYDKMYVVRPQCFIPIITLLRNAALNALTYKQQLALVRNQEIDVSTFEDRLLQFKNDFGIEQIPAAILNDALREGSFLDDPDAGLFFLVFFAIMGRRNENTSKRENEYYSVFRESALRKFASTGIMSDHFWGKRSFTPEERIAIFRRIIRRMEDEPNYHLFLLDETHSFTESEITLYGEECLSMIKPHTTYSPAEEHFEILIQQRDYCSSFRVFFLRQMIPQYTKNERASLRKIKGPIGLLKNLVEHRGIEPLTSGLQSRRRYGPLIPIQGNTIILYKIIVFGGTA